MGTCRENYRKLRREIDFPFLLFSRRIPGMNESRKPHFRQQLHRRSRARDYNPVRFKVFDGNSEWMGAAVSLARLSCRVVVIHLDALCWKALGVNHSPRKEDCFVYRVVHSSRADDSAAFPRADYASYAAGEGGSNGKITPAHRFTEFERFNARCTDRDSR